MAHLKRHLHWYILLALMVTAVAIWFAVFSEAGDGVLTVAFLDVGQGDAIFIETPSGVQVLIDGGANTRVLRELGRMMPFYDRSLDLVIATHPDLDHIGGLVDVLERFSVGRVLDSTATGDTPVSAAFDRVLQDRSIPRADAFRGMNLTLDEGVSLVILFPDRNLTGVDTNDASVIAQLSFGDIEFLFTGDAPQKIEEYLVFLDGKKLESEVLKVGHHGSRTSTAEAFLAAVHPEYSVISAAKNNRYGHPHEEVRVALGAIETTVLETSLAGTIVFYSDGRRVWLGD